MKKYLGLLLLLWTSALAFAQEEDFDFDAYLAKFKSTEEDQYYHRGEEKEWKYVPYKSVKKSKVRRYKNEFFMNILNVSDETSGKPKAGSSARICSNSRRSTSCP